MVLLLMASRVRWDAANFLGHLRETMERTVVLMAEEVIAEAMPDIPVDTGTLRRSHTVTLDELPDAGEIFEAAKTGKSFNNEAPKPRRSLILKDVTAYASGNTPYALMWHERTDWTPGPRNPNAKPKWLENALNRVAPRVDEFVALARKKVFGS